MASEGAGRGGALSRQGSMDAYTRLSDLLTSGGQDPVDLYSSAESGLSGLSGLSVGAPGKGTLDNTLEPHKENQSNGDGDDIAKPTLQLVHTAEPSSSSGSRDGITLSSDVESGPQQQRRTQIPSVPPAPIGRRMSTEAAWDEMRKTETFLGRIARELSSVPEDKVFSRWYDGKGQVESVRTFHGLWAAAGEVAHTLRVTWGLNKGDRVVLAFNFGLRFVAVFLGCLRAGIIAVPVYPPNPATMKKSLQKLQLIVDNCEPKMILLCPLVNKLRLASKLRAVATGNSSGWPEIPYNVPDVKEETPGGASKSSSAFGGWLGGGADKKRNSFDEPNIEPDDVAFLQFTSGSTSDPKGVMLTFKNLEANLDTCIMSIENEIANRGQVPDEIKWFSWLPTFHDMGLIQGTLAPFLAGWSAGYCSPISFLRSPLVWLQLMSKENSHITAAPDFAYRLVTRKWNALTPEAQAAMNLDLSHVKFMQNAAEPVRAPTIRDFATAFTPVGLPPFFQNAAYGLAEHTVGLAAFSANPEGAPLDTIPDERLEASGFVPYTTIHGGVIAIVDTETFREVPAGETGELWASSGCVAKGYWGKTEVNKETFQAVINDAEGNPDPFFGDRKFLRTGDLARIDNSGLLHIEGRLKDLIIVAGRNIYPQDIEFVIQEVSPLIRPGCIAAFSETELGGGLEVVLEVRKVPKKKDDAELMEVLQQVRRCVMNESGLTPTRVVAIKDRTIPKTTSGKIQRRKTRETLHAGELQVVMELSEQPEEELPHLTGAPTDLPRGGDGEASTAEGSTASSTPPYLQAVNPPQSSGAGADCGARGGQPSSYSTVTPSRPPQTTEVSPMEETKDPDADRSTSAIATKGKGRLNRPIQAEDVIALVEKATGIEGLEVDDDLLDLGVDSLVSVGVSSDLSEACGFELPPELVFTHPTASMIAEYIRSQAGSGQPLVDSSDLGTEAGAAGSSTASSRPDNWDCAGGARARAKGERWTMGAMRGWRFRVLQVFLLLLIMMQIFLALQPAWYYFDFIDDLASTSFGGYSKQPWLYVDLPVLGSSDTTRGFGLLIGLAPIIWFSSFTVMVIVAKWIVIGVQAQGRVPLSTHAYLAWWYNNAMLNVWETIGGRWLLGTKLMTLFYRTMGAKVAWTANVKGLLRDFDSLDIRDRATVEGELYARRFEASHMSIMPIVVGRKATVKAGAVVYGGTNIGDKCVVENLTVIPPFSDLAPKSVWEGHPAKAIKKGVERTEEAFCEEDLESYHEPCTFDLVVFMLEMIKQGTIALTLVAMVAMTYIPSILYASTGLSGNFRYAFLVLLALRIFFVGIQLAIFTVAVKWLLAGTVRAGPYQPSAFKSWRRWYLGRLQTLAHCYFIVFNRYRRYDWWGRSLGMKVSPGSIILMAYNPEDAHLLKVGTGSHLASPILQIDSSSGRGTEREKKPVTIGSNAMIGLGSYIGAGCTVGNGSMLGGYALLRKGEQFEDGMVTMCDLQSAFKLGSKPASGRQSLNFRESVIVNLLDALCTVGSWILLILASVASFEVTKSVASAWSEDSLPNLRVIALGTVGVTVWAVSTSLLVFLYKFILVGDFNGKPDTDMVDKIPASSTRMRSRAVTDIEQGGASSSRSSSDLRGAQDSDDSRRANKLGAFQAIRWRWMRRVLNTSLFEPFLIEPVLKGTWLLNAWLRLMGADVSMGALILGRVADYKMAKICDGAVVAGVVYGHTLTFVDGNWSMEIAPTTIGERAVVHEHARVFCTNMGAGSTFTATSSSLSGQVLQPGLVYGGRPSKKLTTNWML